MRSFFICSLWSHLNVLTFSPLTGGCSEGLDAFRFFNAFRFFFKQSPRNYCGGHQSNLFTTSLLNFQGHGANSGGTVWFNSRPYGREPFVWISTSPGNLIRYFSGPVYTAVYHLRLTRWLYLLYPSALSGAYSEKKPGKALLACGVRVQLTATRRIATKKRSLFDTRGCMPYVRWLLFRRLVVLYVRRGFLAIYTPHDR